VLMATGWPMKVTYANGDVYSASDVNDTNGTLNLLGASVAYAAGKNKIINGDFGVWQRGTTFTNQATNAYTVDRWAVTSSNSTIDVTQSSFTPGTAPVAGYESSFYATVAAEATDTDPRFQQKIENVRTFAGQTITVSFYAKSTVTTDAIELIRVQQQFGSGGSTVVNTLTAAFTLTSSWARYSATVAVPSISGKTIGTNNYLNICFDLKASTAQTLDIWGVQVEAGSTASPFQTASGSVQGELALCQRYYQRQYPNATVAGFGVGFAESTIAAFIKIPAKVTMRVAPTALEQNGTAGDYRVFIAGSAVTCTGVPTYDGACAESADVQFNTTGLTAGQGIFIRATNSNAYLAWSAEL